MMAAPCMIASAARGRLERPAEIRLGKGSHVLRHPQLLCCVIKRRQRRTELRVKIIVRRDLVGMRIEPAQRAEENLPPHPELRLHLDNLRYLLQLCRQRGL